MPFAKTYHTVLTIDEICHDEQRVVCNREKRFAARENTKTGEIKYTADVRNCPAPSYSLLRLAMVSCPPKMIKDAPVARPKWDIMREGSDNTRLLRPILLNFNLYVRIDH